MTAISFLLSLFLWRAVKNDFSIVDGSDVIFGGSVVVISITVFLLSALLYSRISASAVAGAFLLPFLFIVGFGWQYLVAALIAFLLFVYAILQIHSARDGVIALRFSAFIFRGTPMLLNAIAVLFACTALFYPFQADKITIPPAWFAYAVSFSEPFIERQIPLYRRGMTVDEFFSAGASSAMAKGADIATMSAQTRALIGAEVARQRNGLTEQLGVRLSGSEDFKELVALIADTYINRYLVSYKDFIPAVVAAFVFLSVKSLGFILDRFAVLFAWGIARLLVAAGVIRKEKIMVEKEILAV